MTKRIFRSIFLVALCVFAASIILLVGVLYNYFSNVQKDRLEMQTALVAQAVSNEGIKYFDGLDTDGTRITWIGKDGSVLYDNKSNSDEMENHLEREEIKSALESGSGESIRYSDTLMERAFYCAKRLPDGTVLRMSISQNTLPVLIFGMAQPICMIFVIAVVLSLVLAFRLSKHIVKPLNELDLDDPLSNEGYDELAPLLKRIESQQRQIRKQSDELKQKQSEFETVTKGMTEGIILLNQKMNILAINPSAVRFFKTTDDCIGKSLLSVSRNLDLQSVLLKAQEGKHSETVTESDGVRYQFIASPVCSDDPVAGIVLLVLDVTEKEKSEQIRREFTANVSHELKTPLHTIAGSAELLENGMVKDEDKNEFYRRIHNESQRMISLVEDIIHLSHLDEGAQDMKREDVDLYKQAEETIRLLSAEAEKSDISITLEGESAVIFGIPQLLQSIIYNLCDNAIKYNHNGGSVDIGIEDKEHSVILTVSDTGIGIPEEHRERIFERFYRVDKSRSKELGGTGLGLSIVKHAARLHNADISLDGNSGGGTVVTVTFPTEEGINKK